MQNAPFGWEPDADGFRGHVFVSTDNSTVIITIKGSSFPPLIAANTHVANTPPGTTPSYPLPGGGGGPTARKDNINDNLLFSCCCARVSYTWRWSTVSLMKLYEMRYYECLTR